jgi:hypothetical protein
MRENRSTGSSKLGLLRYPWSCDQVSATVQLSNGWRAWECTSAIDHGRTVDQKILDLAMELIGIDTGRGREQARATMAEKECPNLDPRILQNSKEVPALYRHGDGCLICASRVARRERQRKASPTEQRRACCRGEARATYRVSSC